MDAAAQYRQLLQLGRDEFLAAAAPAAFVRYNPSIGGHTASELHTLTIDDELASGGDRDEDRDEDREEDLDSTRPYGRDLPDEVDLELYPLAKKPGASFPDRITIGRTANNDVVIPDTSVSRLHAYVRRTGSAWVVADAGSKNGSWLRGVPLDARKEQPLVSRAVVRFGEVDLTFYVASDLYSALGGKQ